MDTKSLIAGLLIGIPVGGELQLLLINRLYGVIGFGLPADVPGAILQGLGVISGAVGVAILAKRGLKPV